VNRGSRTAGLSLAVQPPRNPQRRCLRSYASGLIPRLLPPVLLLVGDVVALISGALRQLAANTRRLRPGRSRPRPPNHVKPHARYAYKG